MILQSSAVIEFYSVTDNHNAIIFLFQGLFMTRIITWRHAGRCHQISKSCIITVGKNPKKAWTKTAIFLSGNCFLICHAPHYHKKKQPTDRNTYTCFHTRLSRHSYCPHTGTHTDRGAHVHTHKQAHTPHSLHQQISVLGAYIRESGRLRAISGPEKT